MSGFCSSSPSPSPPSAARAAGRRRRRRPTTPWAPGPPHRLPRAERVVPVAHGQLPDRVLAADPDQDVFWTQAALCFERRYRLEEKPVAEGTFGAVYMATCRTTQRTVAVKKVVFDGEEDGVPSRVVQETVVFRTTNHPNVIKLLDVFCTPRRMHFVFEFIEMNLKQHMKHLNLVLDSNAVRSLTRQMLRGIEYFHSHPPGIIHGNIKPESILIQRVGCDPGGEVVKIADFGVEEIACWYRAPEILFGVEKYSLPVDIWSAGCIMGEMATGAAIFQGDCEIDTIFRIFQKLGTPTEAEWPGLAELPDFKVTFPKWRKRPWEKIRNTVAQVGSSGADLLERMLTYDPRRRDSARQALAHAYLDETVLGTAPPLGALAARSAGRSGAAAGADAAESLEARIFRPRRSLGDRPTSASGGGGGSSSSGGALPAPASPPSRPPAGPRSPPRTPPTISTERRTPSSAAQQCGTPPKLTGSPGQARSAGAGLRGRPPPAARRAPGPRLLASASRRAERDALLAQAAELGREKEAQQREARERAEQWHRRREEVRRRLVELDAGEPRRKAAPQAASAAQGPASGAPAGGQTAEAGRPADLEAPRRGGSYLPPSAVELLVGGDSCAFCLGPLGAGAQTIALCGHVFHHSCLVAAAGQPGGDQCPRCRGPVDRLTHERLRSTVALVAAVSHEIPVAFANVREVPVSELHARVASARGPGERAASRRELEEALRALAEERPNSVGLIDQDTAIFTW